MSGGVAARILIAGGRTSNAEGAGAYLTTAESIAILEDGSLDPAGWSLEAVEFVHARAFYALLCARYG